MEKNVVKINENTLKQIVAESVKKILKEIGGSETFFERGKKDQQWHKPGSKDMSK